MIYKIKQHWPYLIITVVWLIFCAPYFVKGLVPFPSRYLVTFFPPWNAEYAMPVKNSAMPDVITQIYPWKQLTIDTYRLGQLPLWNPYSFSGTGHAANYQSAVFTPFNLLFFILPFIDAWSILILLQPLLAAIFMIIYIRSLGLSKPAGVIAALSFMFSGFITTWMAYGTLAYALLFLPLALSAVEKVIVNPKSDHFKILLTVAVVLSFLSGHFQISLYVFGAIILYILYRAYSTRNLRVLKLLIYVFLGIAVCAPQLSLTYKAYLESTRSVSFMKGEVIPWKYIVTVLAPDFYGNPVTRNDWFGHYAEWALYIGVVPVLLSIMALLNHKSVFVKFYLGLLLLTLLLAYQSPLVDLLFYIKIPVLSTSAAARIVSISSLALSVLAACGFDRLYQSLRDRKNILIRNYAAFVIFTVLGFWGFLLIQKPYLSDHFVIATRNSLLTTFLAVIFTAAVLVVAVFKNRHIKPAWIGLVILLVAFDMLRFSTKWMPFEERRFMYPETQMTDFLQNLNHTNRVFGNLGGEFAMTYQQPSVEGYDAMYQAKYGRLIKALSDGQLGESGRSVVLFDKRARYRDLGLKLLGLRYFVHRKSDGRSIWAFPVWDYITDMKKIYEDDIYEIYEYSPSVPRSLMVNKYEVTKSEESVIRKLTDSDFDTRTTAILETEPDIKSQGYSGQSSIYMDTPNQVRLRTESTTGGILVLADSFDRGWQAAIDGTKVQIFRVNFDFRAVAVPAGNHEVNFVYWPQYLTATFIISLLSILGTVFLSKKNLV